MTESFLDRLEDQLVAAEHALAAAARDDALTPADR
jgi:hypothetical protein